MSRQVTIKDVARHCGYSFKTVARVIARHPTVADEIRAKVFESIQELGYEPNIAARNLRGGTSYVIGLVYENPVADVQTGALRACEQAGYFLQIMPARKDAADLAANLVHVYRRQRLAGMLLTPPFSENSGLVKELIAEETRFTGPVESATPATDRHCSGVESSRTQLSKLPANTPLPPAFRARSSFLGYESVLPQSSGAMMRSRRAHWSSARWPA